MYSIESTSDWGLTVFLRVLLSLLPRPYIVRPHQKSPYSSVALVTRGNYVVKLVGFFERVLVMILESRFTVRFWSSGLYYL